MDGWEFYKDRVNEWRWRRSCDNGKIVAAATQGYKNWGECLDNAKVSGYVGPIYVATENDDGSTEMILARGETRLGDEHTEADDAQWLSESDS